MSGVLLVTTFLVLAKTPGNPLYIDTITAADRDSAAQAIKAQLAQGVGVGAGGVRDQIQVGLVDLAAFGTITPNAVAGNATISYTNQKQANISDLPAFTVTTTAQANTAIQAIRTAFNTLLAELRASGQIG